MVITRFLLRLAHRSLICDDGSEVHLQNNEQNVQVSDTSRCSVVSDKSRSQRDYRRHYQKQKPQTKTFPIFVIHQS